MKHYTIVRNIHNNGSLLKYWVVIDFHLTESQFIIHVHVHVYNVDNVH